MDNIVYKPIKELKPYKKNAKKHPKEQIEQIANSIKEFGFTQPVLIDKNNCVVAGHGRILGAKKAGLKEVPTLCLDDLTPEQIKAYRLADNKLNESEWNELKDRDTAQRVHVKPGGVPVCPVCGRTALKNYTFCPDCGQRLDQ